MFSESDVPKLAVEALNAAQQRALKSGREVVMVRNGELIRTSSQGVVVLKKLAPLTEVEVRTKRATS